MLAAWTAACCALGVAVGRAALPVAAVVPAVAVLAAAVMVWLLRVPVYGDGAGRDQPAVTGRRAAPPVLRALSVGLVRRTNGSPPE